MADFRCEVRLKAIGAGRLSLQPPPRHGRFTVFSPMIVGTPLDLDVLYESQTILDRGITST
jgi:hypothetical protein